MGPQAGVKRSEAPVQEATKNKNPEGVKGKRRSSYENENRKRKGKKKFKKI